MRILALSLLLHPTSALACTVCFSATDQSRAAYVATTVFLSLLPLALFYGVYRWLRERMHAQWMAEGLPTADRP